MSPAAGRTTGLAVIGVVTVMLCTGLLASPAWAHVTVHPEALPAGSHDIELTFRVPNERDNADTVVLQVFFPTSLPLLAVDVMPIPGWTSTVDTRTLTQPIQTDDGPVSQVVSDITWKATAGGITAGQYQDFPVAAGKAPMTTGDVVFKTLQTYSSGEVVRWIQVASSQNPNPDSPAPTLTLTGPTPTGTATTSPSSSGSANGIAIASLVVAVIGLLGVLTLFVRIRRRTDGIGGP
jgi:uncharacterized protein YcnI